MRETKQMQNNANELIASISKLAAIRSTADNPSGLRAAYIYMRELLRAHDPELTIEEFEDDGYPSLLAYVGATRPKRFHLLLNAHLDVVPGKSEQFVPYTKNGKLYGRGVYDMKAAAVVMAEAFCEYARKVPYAIGLQITTDEESSGRHGTGYQVEQGVRADFVLCGECGRAEGTYEIANEAKGVAAVALQFTGTAAHGAYPWRGDNAAAKAAYFVTEVWRRYPTPTEPTGETTVTVTGIAAGGEVHNQIADLATVTVDCRYAPGDPHFAGKKAIAALFHSINPEARIAKYINFGPPAHADRDNPLLLALKSAAEQTEHHEFAFARRNGASDGRYFTTSGGQVVEFGVAGYNQHADNEYITLASLQNYRETLRGFLEKTIGSG